jgi:UDP:flavonoid glycosyltransferase YjiC (YdhE family)
MAIAEAWKPDVIVREGMEYGGCITAECLGIPHASIAGNACAAIDSPKLRYFPGNRLLVAEPLARHREQFRLPPDPETRMPFRYLHLCFTPPAWDPPDVPRPANTRFVRHRSAEVHGAELPEWFVELPDCPTVLASLGTVFNKTPGVLEAIIEALSEEQLNLVVAIGRDRHRARFGSQPANVRLEAYVPQPAVLAHCDLFITHGGFNSVKESVSEGVPMVAIPITADQPYSASRCAALGVAEVIEPEQRSPEKILAAARKVMADPSYRANAKNFRAEMAALAGPQEMVTMLEALDRQPVTT